MAGKKNMDELSGLPKSISTTNSIRRANRRLIKLDKTEAIGKVSLGKYAFLTKLASSMIDVVASDSPLEKKLHGRRPDSKNSGYVSI